MKCQLTKIEYNDGSYYQFAYDSLGRKISETGGAGGQGTIFGSVKYTGGGEEYNEAEYGEFKYGTDTPLYGFDPDLTTIYYSYDAAGRLTRISYLAPPDAPLLPDGTRQRKDISYEYYADDKIKKITDAAGYDRVYNYDNQNRLISITIDGKTVTYHYDDDNYGRLDYIMLPNGVKKEYVYGEDDSLNAVLYTRNSGTITLFRFDYKYNKTGNISSIVKTDPYGNKSINSYNYDSVNRLLSVLKEGKGDSLKSWYDFDPMGNRLKKNLSGVLSGGQITKTENYDYNACDELKCHDGILFEYDMNGNLIRKTDPAEGQTGYVFNYANRLFKTVFPDNTESVNNYASSGLRSMSRDKTGNTAHYYWDGLNIESIPNAISESDDKGNITNTYLPGIGFRHINNNNNWRWFITDHLGSIIALTDDAGNVCDIYEYDEYGIQTTSKGTSFNTYRYIGQQFDKAEGLLYLRARYYNPETGRFVSRDPIGIGGGMNEYEYTKQNPVSYIDLSGNNNVSYKMWFFRPATKTGYSCLCEQSLSNYKITFTGAELKVVSVSRDWLPMIPKPKPGEPYIPPPSLIFGLQSQSDFLKILFDKSQGVFSYNWSDLGNKILLNACSCRCFWEICDSDGYTSKTITTGCCVPDKNQLFINLVS